MILKVFLNGILQKEIQLDTSKEYSFGRDSNSDVVLEGSSFSRTHFKVIFNGNHWEVELLSKYASLYINNNELKQFDLNNNTSFQAPPYSFTTTEEVSEVNDPSLEEYQEPSLVSHSNEEIQINPDPIENDESEKQTASQALIEEDENTSIGTVLGEAFLTITHSNNNQEVLKLEGKKWYIGRSDECEIHLPDGRLSRSHFCLTEVNNRYYIEDLNSSNGTLVNDTRLNSKQVVEVQSGDQIRAGNTFLLFEIRDPDFEQRIDKLPMKVDSPNIPAVRSPNDLGLYGQQTTHNPIQLRQNQIPGHPAAVRIPNSGSAKTKKARFYMVVIIILLGTAFWLNQEKNKEKQQQVGKVQLASENLSPFDRLDKDKQSLIRNKLGLAFEYYIQGDYEKAMAQTKAIHIYLPEGYKEADKDSKAIEDQSRKQLAIARNVKKLEAEERRKQEIQQKIKDTIARCDAQAKPGTSIAAAKKCLAYVTEYDPENPSIDRITNRLQSYFDEQERAQRNRAYYASQVSKGEALYFKAVRVAESNKPLQAIKAYQVHIASKYPDPKNLKEKSKNSIIKIEKGLASKIESLFTEANSLYENQNYKESIYKLRDLLDIDPSVGKAQELLTKVSRELNNSLKTKYTESTLLENQGEVEAAKAIWHNIKKMDVKNGNYYRKADSKLRKYGG